MPLARFLCLLELEAMWFSRLGALLDKYEGMNPKGARALIMRIGKEYPDFKNAKTPWGGSYKELLALTDNGRSGDVGRKTVGSSGNRRHKKCGENTVTAETASQFGQR